MYKPLLLGISNADPVVVYGVLIVILLGFISFACICFYHTGCYIIKSLRRLGKKKPSDQPDGSNYD